MLRFLPFTKPFLSRIFSSCNSSEIARNINRPYKNASRKIQSVLYDKCNNFSKFSHDAKVCIVRIEKELFNLKRQKNFILRRESELLYMLANLLESFRLQETILQEEYTKLKDEVHFLQTISNNEKAQDDQEREDAMVEQMISIVEQRNNMLLDIDIERLRENEEDAELYEEHEKKEKDEKSQNNFRTEIELNGERPLAALKRQVFMNSSQQGLRKLNKQASEECTIL